MSRQINQPINQVKLTNVAVVRLNKGGKRFEIACYKNKIVNYRQGLETDLSEVLQTERIFSNVSKGQFANSKDLMQVFDTSDEEEIAKLILIKGVMQVSDKEREQHLENVQREVATWVAHNCVHPASQRPYTVTQIRDAMRQAEFAVHPTKSVKRQYLECVKLLQAKQVLMIERAKMELCLYYSRDKEARVAEVLTTLDVVATRSGNVNSDKESSQVLLVDPSSYRRLDELAKEADGRLEILRQVVQQEGDVGLEQELERRRRGNAVAMSSRSTTTTVDELANQMHSTTLESGETGDGATSLFAADSDGTSPQIVEQLTRKTQKKAQKKSKKAKRREKEEEETRQARVEAEQQRREERAARVGVTSMTVPSEQTDNGDSASGVRSCNTCGGSFASATEYRAHFRSDWHRYNVKLKMKGVDPISEEEYRLCDSDAFFEGM